MKSFARTLTIPFMIAALAGCGGSGSDNGNEISQPGGSSGSDNGNEISQPGGGSGSDNGNEISQPGDISNLLTTGLSYFWFDTNQNKATLHQYVWKLDSNIFTIVDPSLFDGTVWESIADDDDNDHNYKIVWDGTTWVVYNNESDCTVQSSTSNKLTSTCHPGYVVDISMVSSPIAGTSIQAAMQNILEEEWLNSTEVAAIQAGIDYITSNFSNDARAYRMQIEQVTGNVELDWLECDFYSASTSSTPELTDFNCTYISDATSFDDLFEDEFVFNIRNDSNVSLTRESVDATSGNILSGDEIIAQWSLVTIEGDLKVLQLTMADEVDNEYNALVVYNDGTGNKLVRALYIPANSVRYIGLLFNSTAIDDLTYSLFGNFPVDI